MEQWGTYHETSKKHVESSLGIYLLFFDQFLSKHIAKSEEHPAGQLFGEQRVGFKCSLIYLHINY